MEGIWLLLVLGLWVLVQTLILPRFGISTCLAGRCRLEDRSPKK